MHQFVKTTMKIIILAFLVYILCIQEASSNEEKWVDYRYVSKGLNARQSASPCRRQGWQCVNCSQAIFCYSINNQWFIDSTVDCAQNTTCNNGNCTAGPPGRECTAENNKCGTTEGMYPDPSSCKKFTYCVPSSTAPGTLTLISSQCPSNYSYNARTTYCDKLLPNDVCTGYPVPECNRSAQSGALTENPTIFYICRPVPGVSGTLFPYLDACKNGKRFDASTNTCR